MSGSRVPPLRLRLPGGEGGGALSSRRRDEITPRSFRNANPFTGRPNSARDGFDSISSIRDGTPRRRRGFSSLVYAFTGPTSRATLYRMGVVACLLVIIFVLLTVYTSEVLTHTASIRSCSWPPPSSDGGGGAHAEDGRPDRGKPGDDDVRVLFLADPHLVGDEGSWIDRVRRDFQMKRAFRNLVSILRPEVVVILGDIFDEGKWASKAEWERYVNRFDDIFRTGDETPLVTAVGNHDIGFHKRMRGNAKRMDRFEEKFGSLSRVRTLSFSRGRRLEFISINSMAYHDNCNLCSDARTWTMVEGINRRRRKSAELRKKGRTCTTPPILLTHFPLYRASETQCATHDVQSTLLQGQLNRPGAGKRMPHHVPFQYDNVVGHDVISAASSQLLLTNLRPRMVFSAHTHYYCTTQHSLSDVMNTRISEITVSTFSWRNRLDPSVVLASIPSTSCTTNNYTNISHNVCYLTTEDDILFTYTCTALLCMACFIPILLIDLSYVWKYGNAPPGTIKKRIGKMG